MNSSHEDAVLSFDLDFLHPTTNNIPVQALKQRYIGQIKKRIIRVDALNNHCNSLKIDLSNKNKELDLIKKKLESTNQEHTQTSLEYKDILESYSKCEMSISRVLTLLKMSSAINAEEREFSRHFIHAAEKGVPKLKSAVNTYQEKYYEAENRVHAGKSHVVQLQQLVKQYEGQIETLQQNDKKRGDKTLREGLEKELLQWKKKYKKEISEWQTKYDKLLKQVQEMKSGSRKLNKHSSPKHDKCSSEIGDSMSFDENSDNEDETVDFISEVISQTCSQNKVDATKSSSGHNMRMEAFSDTKIESVSVDTGCGSSLASSDNEKWLNSPDYYFSPINGESANKIPSRKGVDIATSPIIPVKTTDTGSSPIPLINISTLGSVSDSKKLLHNPDHYFSPINEETANKASCKLVDIATSPILPVKTIERANSPIPSIAVTNVDINVVNTANKPVLPVETTERANSPISSLAIFKVDVKMVDVATNTKFPVKTTERAISPMPALAMANVATSPIKQLNTCRNVEDDRNTDREIEMIFSNMRFDHKLITPLPKSPKRTRLNPKTLSPILKSPKTLSPILKSPKRVGSETATSDCSNTKSQYLSHNECPEAAIAKDLSEAAKQEAAQAKKDIAKTNESQKLLISNLANLMKDMFYIKTFLKSQFTTPGTALEHLDASVNCNDLLDNVSSIGSIDENQNVSESVNLFKQNFDKTPTSPKLTKHSRVTIISDEIIKPANIVPLTNNEDEGEIVSYGEQEMCVPEECVKENETPAEPGITTGDDVKAPSPIKETIQRRVKRFRKLTNLAKYRYKCVPRNCKIKRETPPLRRPLMKPKQVPCRRIKKVTRNDTSATLNDKQIYAKAVKVMAELNAKTKDNADTAPHTGTHHKAPEQTKHNNNTTNEKNKMSSVPASDLPSPPPKLTSPVPDKDTVKPESVTTTPIKSRRRSTRTSKTFDVSPESTIKPPTDSTGLSTIAQRSWDPKITSPTRVIITPSPFIASLSPKKGQSSSVITSPLTPPRRSTRLSSVASTPKSNSPNSNAPRKRPSITSPQPEDKLQPIASPPGIIEPPKSRKALPMSSEVSKTGPTERKRKLSQTCDVQSKRVLRSSSINQSVVPKEQTAITDNVENEKVEPADVSILDDSGSCHPKDSVLCTMIQKYGVRKVKPAVRHVPDAVLKNVTGLIEQYMSKIREGPPQKDNITMVELVEEVKALNYKHLVSGLTKYLTHADRKMELFGKTSAPPAPQMTKCEAVLLYVLRQVRSQWRPVDLVATLLSSLEHALFKLSRTPEFGVIESVSHFYALVCRYFGLQSRLKVFMLDAMYCILYKSAPLIKECLEVWPHIIPLAHMNTAKLPLMTIFVYLLHFYKCEDRFSRVQEIRNILSRKYSYQATEWNETKILEMVGNSISELKNIPCERKMLRLAIIILSKRQGPRWTQNNIIKKLGQFIEKPNVPEHVTAFCVSLIGPLMRPYPIDMKVYCEIAINQLLNTLNRTTSKTVEEATLSSMLIMSRHNTQRITEILLSRKMDSMSPELSKLFRIHIRMKPLNMWIKSLSGNSTVN